MNKSEFLTQAAELSNESSGYLEAAFEWATAYALPLDDAWTILRAAADKYAGEYASLAEFAQSYYESTQLGRLESIRAIAAREPIIEFTFEWEIMARLTLPNTAGFEYEEFNGHYFWAAD